MKFIPLSIIQPLQEIDETIQELGFDCERNQPVNQAHVIKLHHAYDSLYGAIKKEYADEPAEAAN